MPPTFKDHSSKRDKRCYYIIAALLICLGWSFTRSPSCPSCPENQISKELVQQAPLVERKVECPKCDAPAPASNSVVPASKRNAFINVKPSTDKKTFRAFIVTYKQGERLYRALDDVIKGFEKYDSEITVINNYGNLDLPERFAGKVRIIDNLVRPDFSTGHLPRDWNTCLLYGFKNLQDPISEIVVCLHGDAQLLPGWADFIYKLHKEKKKCFTSFGVGDALTSYTAEGVKKIGMWDERFCNIGIQEKDYFLRAKLYAPDCATVNDRKSVVYNPEPNEVIDHPNVRGITNKDESHLKSIGFHPFSRSIFRNKWGFDMHALRGDQMANGTVVPEIPKIPSFILYPFFELDVEKLFEKGYILPKRNIYDQEPGDEDEE